MRNPYPMKLKLRNYLRYFYCKVTNKKAWIGMEDIRIENRIHSLIYWYRPVAFNIWYRIGKRFKWIKVTKYNY